MTESSINYITPLGYEGLKEELRGLLHIERPKIVETVAWAASNGDRSENGDYIYGKRRLREIDRRIRYLTKKIESAQVVDQRGKDSDSVVFGMYVTIEDESGQEKRYQIVGEDEIDITHNKMSWKAPLARALLGKKEGDEVLVKRPKDEVWFTIISIQAPE